MLLGNGCGIQGQNYVALLQGSGMLAWFHTKNLILGICFRLINLKVFQWSNMVSKSVLKSSGPRSFPEKTEYEFAFQF